MRMTATVHRPSISCFPLPFMLVYGFSNLCIAAHLLHPQAKFAKYLMHALAIKAAVNAIRLVTLSRTIPQVVQKTNEENERKKLKTIKSSFYFNRSHYARALFVPLRSGDQFGARSDFFLSTCRAFRLST